MTLRRQIYWSMIGLAYVGAIIGGLLAWQAYQATSVVLDWTTASELDTAGFNVYRSNNPDGPYQKINQTLIPSSPDPITGGDYSFADTEVEAGETYYYQLEEVEINGEASRFGPREVEAQVGGRTELIIALSLASIGLTGTALMFAGQSEDHDMEQIPSDS